jgi:translation initiation factor 4B
MKPDAPAKPPVSPREPSNPPSPAAPPAPAVRPKLNLQKRTVSEADPNAPATDVKASPFAGARPIDTSAREREVEERHQLAVRQKKEAEEKAKAEKAEKQKLAREQAKEQAKEPSKAGGADSNGSKDDVETAQGGKNFEILRRAGEEQNGMAADVDADAPSAKTPTAGKPPVLKGPSAQQGGKPNGNWRSGGQASQRAEAAPASADDDGWSTVSSKPRNNRRGGGRGYAS